jgi:PTH1 family peptidyl-tRNA hydrolase
MTDGLLSRLRRVVGSDPATPAPEEDGPFHIRLVVGLGNPGKEHAANRHNVGYWTINRLARRHGIELDTAREASSGSGVIHGHPVVLAKPRTFVNKSGNAVWNLIKRLELDDARELLVVYDELDLPLGKVRLRAKGGPGGHNGVKSIISRTGNDKFNRVRIGIGRPLINGEPSWDPDAVAAYVLSDPPQSDRAVLDEAVERAQAAIECAVAEGIDAAMQRHNG